MNRLFHALPPILSLGLSLCMSLALIAGTAHAEPPRITEARAERDAMGWRFFVTILHPDTGWDHYADGWEVLDDAGNRLGFRELHHPHVNEQPFTRSLGQVMVPDGTRRVYVRAYCSNGDRTGTSVPVDLHF